MTKRGVKPGSKRGPYKKRAKLETAIAEIDADIVAVRSSASELLTKAYATLDLVMDKGTSASMVAAARIVIDLAAAENGVGKGKRAEQAERAKVANSGRFATPPAPKLVVNNG